VFTRVFHSSRVGVLRRRLQSSSSYPIYCFPWRCLLFKYCRAAAWGSLFITELLVGFIYSAWGSSTSTSCSQDWCSPSSGYVYCSRDWKILSELLDQKVHRERLGKQSVSSWYQSARLITVQVDSSEFGSFCWSRFVVLRSAMVCEAAVSSDRNHAGSWDFGFRQSLRQGSRLFSFTKLGSSPSFVFPI
jgi:hypothetical protein